MPAPPPRRSPSVLVFVLLASALAVGAAAAILVTATGTGANGPGPAPELFLGDDVVAAAIVGIFALLAASLIYQRVRHGGGFQTEYLVAIFALVLVMVGMTLLLQYLWAGGGYPSTAPVSGGNGSGGSGQNGTLNGTGGSFEGVHFPPWALFVAVGVVAVVVGVLVVPAVRAYLVERGDRRRLSGVPTEEARAALGEAAHRLSQGFDPRGVILDLYAGLLSRIGPLAGNIDPATPDEIRTGPLVQLGIRPAAAEALTRLFEEARYSSHPMGADAVTRAQAAIGQAESDLAKASPGP